MGHTAQLLLMHLNGFDEQCRVGGPLITNFVVGDDLIFRFLDLDQSAELDRGAIASMSVGGTVLSGAI